MPASQLRVWLKDSIRRVSPACGGRSSAHGGSLPLALTGKPEESVEQSSSTLAKSSFTLRAPCQLEQRLRGPLPGHPSPQSPASGPGGRRTAKAVNTQRAVGKEHLLQVGRCQERIDEASLLATVTHDWGSQDLTLTARTAFTITKLKPKPGSSCFLQASPSRSTVRPKQQHTQPASGAARAT